jgi:DNA-directed RNA polymerase subunit RPC12/RpoP
VNKKVYLILIFEILTQRLNIMQRQQDLWKLDEGDCPLKTHEKDFTCDGCGRTFQRPILATVSTSGQTQTYYACPRCMTKVQSFRASAKENEEKNKVLTAEPRKLTPTPDVAVSCGHFFGYLNKHQKNMPFPDECLTCPKMVECMLY